MGCPTATSIRTQRLVKSSSLSAGKLASTAVHSTPPPSSTSPPNVSTKKTDDKDDDRDSRWSPSPEPTLPDINTVSSTGRGVSTPTSSSDVQHVVARTFASIEKENCDDLTTITTTGTSTTTTATTNLSPNNASSSVHLSPQRFVASSFKNTFRSLSTGVLTGISVSSEEDSSAKDSSSTTPRSVAAPVEGETRGGYADHRSTLFVSTTSPRILSTARSSDDLTSGIRYGLFAGGGGGGDDGGSGVEGDSHVSDDGRRRRGGSASSNDSNGNNSNNFLTLSTSPGTGYHQQQQHQVHQSNRLSPRAPRWMARKRSSNNDYLIRRLGIGGLCDEGFETLPGKPNILSSTQQGIAGGSNGGGSGVVGNVASLHLEPHRSGNNNLGGDCSSAGSSVVSSVDSGHAAGDHLLMEDADSVERERRCASLASRMDSAIDCNSNQSSLISTSRPTRRSWSDRSDGEGRGGGGGSGNPGSNAPYSISSGTERGEEKRLKDCQ